MNAEKGHIAKRVARHAMQAFTYPDNTGRPVRRDPSHGAIDREVQWFVQDTFQPTTVAERVVMESKVQLAWDAR